MEIKAPIKILQLSPRFCFPADDGGKIGISNNYKMFSKLGAQVYFFCLNNSENYSKSDMDYAKSLGEVEIFDHFPKNSIPNAIKSLILNQPLYLLKHNSKKIIARLEELYEKYEFDVVHADHSAMAPLALHLKRKYGVPVGLRLHNVEYMIWKRYADELLSLSPKKIFIDYQARLLKNAERNLYKKCDVCFAITDVEKQTALNLSPKANILVSNAGIEPELWAPDETVSPDPETMILATTYKWVHNVEGLIWFLDKVLPIIIGKKPQAKLRLLGKNVPDKIYEYADKGVEIIGYVDSVAPFLEKALVYISPLFVGAGVRIKILEAMSAGKPVVATKVGAEGIHADEKSGLFITDDPQEFADKILYLFENEKLIQDLGKKARKYVIDNFSVESNVKIMLDEYYKLAGR